MQTDNRFSLLLGCTFSWTKMGPICILVLCVVRDYRPYSWHRYSGMLFKLQHHSFTHLKDCFLLVYSCFVSILAGLCRITSHAEHHIAMHRDKQRWRILCSKMVVFVHVYSINTHMGCAQHICLGSHRFHRHYIYMVAGKSHKATTKTCVLLISIVLTEYHNSWVYFLFRQMIGGAVIVIMLPLVALTTKPASFVFSHFEMMSSTTGISDKVYAVVLSMLVSQYSLYGYDAAAHLTEETRGADKNGPIAILTSLGIISVFGWAYILALTFSIQVHYFSV